MLSVLCTLGVFKGGGENARKVDFNIGIGYPCFVICICFNNSCFIFFITRTLEICKAIINKDRVKRKKQTGIKIFQAMLTLCSVVSSFAVFAMSFDSIILVFVFGAISAYFWIYDMYIFGIAAADHLNENYDNKKHT